MEKTGSFPSHPTAEGTLRMMHVVKAAGWGEEQKGREEGRKNAKLTLH